MRKGHRMDYTYITKIANLKIYFNYLKYQKTLLTKETIIYTTKNFILQKW